MRLSVEDHAATPPRERMRRTGIAAIGDLKWGSHLCHFFESRNDYLSIVAPYFQAGLEDNEFCLWLSSRDLPPPVARTELKQRLPDLDRHVAEGRIQIVDAERFYLRDGSFDAQAVLRSWNETLANALERGFAGLRVNANESWIPGETLARFAAYEEMLDSAIAGKPMLALCTYPLANMSAGELFDFARCHQGSIALRHGHYAVLERSQHLGANARADGLNVALERLVAERTDELAEAQEALQESNNLYHFIADHMSDIVGLHDQDANLIYLSPSAARILGKMPDDLFVDIHPEDFTRARQAFAEVLAGEDQSVTVRYRIADGSWRWFETQGLRVFHRGQPFVLTVARDVSDRIGLEEQLHHAQKMEALGRLAGGVAHDFNNLLTAIFGYAELALGDLPPESPAEESLDEIKLAAERARGVTRQLLTFSRREPRNPHVLELNSLIRGLERMLRLLVREDIELAIRNSGERLLVFGDAVQVEQALVNLVSNARDATPRGGVITIACQRRLVSGETRGLPSYVRPGDYAMVTVTDTGSGMPADIAAQAFDPFFTTKPQGIGTGLGLSTVFGVVKQCGGFVWIETEAGQGTRVQVLIPIAPAECTAEQVPGHRASAASLAGLRVAVVEDEAVLRHFVCAVLRRNGAEVVAYDIPVDALDALVAGEEAVDLVLTDVVMPGMTGPSLAAGVRKALPKMPVVFMSGYTADEDARAASLNGAVLEKPFTPAELVDRIASAMEMQRAE